MLKLSKAHRNLTEELVVWEVDELKLSQVRDTPRNHVGEGVRWKIKVVEADTKFVGDLAEKRWFCMRLRIFKLVRFPIYGRRILMSELYCKNTKHRRVHLERERGMVPLKAFERRLYLSFFVFVSWWVYWFLVFVWLLRKFWILILLFGCHMIDWGGASFLFGWWEMRGTVEIYEGFLFLL